MTGLAVATSSLNRRPVVADQADVHNRPNLQ